MTDTQLLTVAAALVATMFGLLTTVLGWLGSRMYVKLESIEDKQELMAAELHDKVNKIGDRVTRIEAIHEAGGTCLPNRRKGDF